ncbi:hypothetical protein [Georgenia sp. SYP-B2076]|uniref:hypothetical protein n=1 Tax=Georgenia sp. SYP-B2076 TaxID=2495881 RepID=UPI000F8DC6B0|nr:hypothetical protein [Georgenia sp. SYP-B2076]
MSSQPTGQPPHSGQQPGTGQPPVPRQPPSDPAGSGHDPHFDPVLLEEDETVPPRPEEEAADLLRAEPDPQD